MATNQRELCRYFLNGVCRFGSSCFNSHDRNDRPSTVCQYYLKGFCVFGNSCRYDHVKPRVNRDLPSIDLNHPSNTNTCLNNINNIGASNEVTIANNTQEISHKVERPLYRQLNNNTTVNSNMLVLGKKKNNSENNDKQSSENDINNDLNSEKLKESNSNKSYFEALTGSKKPITNLSNEEYDPFNEENHKIDLCNNLEHASQLCPYFEKEATCPFGFECQYIHGEMCELCNSPCLHPYDEKQREQHRIECTKQLEKDMEEAFATQCSQDKQCGICMEIVWEKEKTEQCFGILENCNHVFCLTCIRKWRASKTYENKVVKACPECRVKSDYVTPSHFWFENETEKAKIIEEYKEKLGKTACKYFKQGSGSCPFGNKCFYQHLLPDGTKAELPSPTRRRRLNGNGVLESFSNIVRVDFELSDDESEYDLIEFLRQNLLADNMETDSELSDLSLSELLDDYIYYFN